MKIILFVVTLFMFTSCDYQKRLERDYFLYPAKAAQVGYDKCEVYPKPLFKNYKQ